MKVGFLYRIKIFTLCAKGTLYNNSPEEAAIVHIAALLSISKVLLMTIFGMNDEIFRT